MRSGYCSFPVRSPPSDPTTGYHTLDRGSAALGNDPSCRGDGKNVQDFGMQRELSKHLVKGGIHYQINFVLFTENKVKNVSGRNAKNIGECRNVKCL